MTYETVLLFAVATPAVALVWAFVFMILYTYWRSLR